MVRIEEFAKGFDDQGVTWSRYRTFAQVVDEDPDCSTKNPMFAMVDHPGSGAYLTPGNPTAFSNAERSPPGRAPRLGENTEEILNEIGYSSSEIAKLHDARVIASAT